MPGGEPGGQSERGSRGVGVMLQWVIEEFERVPGEAFLGFGGDSRRLLVF